MKEAHLRDFIAVVEHGGVRAAARQLKLTQAAVSRNLLALEQACGNPLLIRSNHGIELTDFGRILLRRARAADAELRKAAEEMEALSGRSRGGVSVGLSSAAEAALMPGAIEAFRRACPHTLVRVTGGPAVITTPALREGRLDFIVGGSGANKDNGLLSERLMSSDLAIAARKDHPLARSTSLAQLAASEWVVGIPTAAPEAELGSILASHGLPPPGIAVQRDSNGIVHLLAGTDRLALVTLHTVQLFCDAGLLCTIPVREAMPAVALNLVTVDGRPLTAAAQALANEFRRQARAHRR